MCEYTDDCSVWCDGAVFIQVKKRWKYVLNMFGLPLAIEFSQFLWCISLNSHYRTADIDDVLLNALGILIGYVIYRYLPDRIKKFFKF